MSARPPVPDDDELMELLARAIALDGPAPSLVATAAQDAHSMWDIDALLAQVTFDSDASELAGARGVEEFRMLSFSTGTVDVEVEFATDGHTARGRVLPPEADAEVQSARGDTPIVTDGLGRFSLDLPPGRLRFAVALPSGRRVVTPWVFR